MSLSFQDLETLYQPFPGLLDIYRIEAKSKPTNAYLTTESLNDLFSSVYYSCADALIAPTKTHMQKLDIIVSELVNLKMRRIY